MHSGYHLQGIYCIPGIAPNSSQVVLKFIITKPCESYPHFHMRPLKTQSSFETCPSSHGTAPGGTVAKSPPWRRKHKTWDLIPGSGRFPGAGNGKPPQYPSLGNPKDRGAWWATVHGVTRVEHDLVLLLLLLLSRISCVRLCATTYTHILSFFGFPSRLGHPKAQVEVPEP